MLTRVAYLLLLASIAINVAALLRFWVLWQTTPISAQVEGFQLVIAVPTTTPTPAPTATATSTPTATAIPSPTPTATPSPTPVIPRIGIIAGHWKNDSGAICEEGQFEETELGVLEEVDVTLNVARQVTKSLQDRGYRVDLLPEFAPELYGYEADVLLSIHADSCLEAERFTGFKVARASQSAIPAIEDRLVGCLYTEYAQATDLPRHDSSLTHDMLSYHAFFKIDPQTPAAIIEIGFLYHDRELLTDESERVTEGIVNGIHCFLTADSD